ncbi:MAG: hypothetical protein Ct9H300mP8_04220 [Gammaproteobacteria bacterium]|nr:MAG: hypothetical protein Ct9H300mP8_04220 [Gammaproteobacteria bacterium]
MRYQLTGNAIEKSLKTIAARDRNVRRALEIVGYPEARRRPKGLKRYFGSLLGSRSPFRLLMRYLDVYSIR